MSEPANELEALDTLINSAGWRLMQDKLQAEWGRSGQRYGDLIEKMANNVDREQVADEIQRVIWVQKELQAFFRSFVDRVAQLKAGRTPQEPSPSRRGVL